MVEKREEDMVVLDAGASAYVQDVSSWEIFCMRPLRCRVGMNAGRGVVFSRIYFCEKHLKSVRHIFITTVVYHPSYPRT
jgi:hypothetical protein